MRLTPSAQIKDTTALTNTPTVKNWHLWMIINAQGKTLLVDAANPAEQKNKEEMIELMARKDVLTQTLNAEVWLHNINVTKNSEPLLVLKL